MVINLDSMERSEIKAEWMAAVSCGSYRWRIDRGYKKKNPELVGSPARCVFVIGDL
jgi:hypothetical protein